MRTYFILFAFCLISFIGFSQKLQLEKASPFTAVKWKSNQPIVKFNAAWYHLEKLNIYTTKELLDFCKKEFGKKWKKRFSEDLIEVLKAMGAKSNKKVNLILSNGTQVQNAIGTYTFKNRQKVLNYNYEHKKRLKTVSISQAVEDIVAFQQILENRSSYVQLTDYNYKTALDLLKNTVVKSTKAIDINYLTHEFAKIMAEIGDRHSSVKNEAFAKETHATYFLQLPFIIAPINGKAVALKRLKKEGEYEYFYSDFPILKSINNLSVDAIIDSLVYTAKKAPKEAKLTKGIIALQQLGKCYFMNNLIVPKQVEIVFTNGKTAKIEVVQLQKKRVRYASKLERNTFLKSSAIHKGNFKSISKVLKGNIGYIALPEMFYFNEIDGLEQHIDSVFTAFYTRKALIIDVRFNPGGTRDFIQKFARYIIPKSASPWVANVAYFRTGDKNVIHKSMSSRFLYTDTSNKFNNMDSAAIDVFSKNFTAVKEFDTTKFSNPHYMVLKSGHTPYLKPIYILVNERSFSAASVFSSAFKGLPNVCIVGVTSDGASGNSKTIHLQHSNIRVKISRMLSFQRNGKTLDGFGTKPDIYIPENATQILAGDDFQLKRLIKIINNNE